MAGVSEHNNSDESEESQSEEREVEEREDNALPCGIPDEGSPVWTWLLWGFFAVFLTIILGQTLIYTQSGLQEILFLISLLEISYFYQNLSTRVS